MHSVQSLALIKMRIILNYIANSHMCIYIHIFFGEIGCSFNDYLLSNYTHQAYIKE